MQSEFVIVVADVYCKWTGEYPIYRCFFNQELFSERTWIWRDSYLQEEIQVQAPPGYYELHYEVLGLSDAKLKIRNVRIKTGPGHINPKGLIQIYTPERSK